MPKTILIADAANIRVRVKDYLQEEGYRVVTAENGQVALDSKLFLLWTTAFALILIYPLANRKRV